MDKSQKYIEIEGFAGHSVRVNVEFSQLETDAPVVILAHGFKAHKDWSFIPVLAQKLAFHGFHVVRFSNSHCGVIDESGEFAESEKFADNSLSKEMTDFTHVLRSTNNGEIKGIFETERRKISGIHLLGHSRGSANALIVASENIDKIKIDSLVCLSPISHYLHYSEAQFKSWLERGYIEILEPNTGVNLRLNRIYRDDMFENVQRYNLKNAVERLANVDLPVLFVRGDDDKYILQEEAEELVGWSQGKYELEIVTGSSDEPAEHNFGMPAIAHDFNSPMNWAFKLALGFMKLHSA